MILEIISSLDKKCGDCKYFYTYDKICGECICKTNKIPSYKRTRYYNDRACNSKEKINNE